MFRTRVASMVLIGCAVIVACSSEPTAVVVGDADAATGEVDDPTLVEPPAEVSRGLNPVADDSAPIEATDDPGSEATPGELNVGYFLEWPTPNLIDQSDGRIAEALGVEVNWIPLSSGGEMSEALVAGSIDIAYSQGFTPFMLAANEGLPIRLVGISVIYTGASQCFVQEALQFDAGDAQRLNGAVIGESPTPTFALSLRDQLEHLGVDVSTVTFQESWSSQIVDQFRAGAVDVGCVFGEDIEEMLAMKATPLMAPADQEQMLGFRQFDVVSTSLDFGTEFPSIVAAFLRETSVVNSQWEDKPEAMNPALAELAALPDVGDFLSGETWFSFPTLSEQLSSDHLGGDAAALGNRVLAWYAESNPDVVMAVDLEEFVDTSYLVSAVGS